MRLAAISLGLCLCLTGTALAHPPGYPPRVRPQPQVFPPRPFPPGYPPVPPVAPVIPVQPVPQLPPALTLDQFSRVFSPTPGKHDVWLIHPQTQQPVLVCFTLPHHGKLDRFEVKRRSIEFRFDRPDFEVYIDFRKDGTVRVEYDD